MTAKADMYAIHAPAKVNLYLHVGPPREDGRHPLDSLVVFSDERVADKLTFQPGGQELSFSAFGRAADTDLGPVDSNLVVRAVKALETQAGVSVQGRLVLDKQLPVAAGIGGGSSDAAATLHLLNGALQLGLSVEKLSEIAIPLGGDVPACVAGRPVLMRGDGDRVEPFANELPDLPAVLITPDVSCPTGPVFRKYDQTLSWQTFQETEPPFGADTRTLCARLSSEFRNDLQQPALAIHEDIARVLDALKADPKSLFSAMSGSGATCFSIFECSADADTAATRLTDFFPDAWVRVTYLGKAGFDPQGFKL